LDSFWQNSFVQTAGYYSVTVQCIILFLFIFELVTKYNNLEEIKSGNVAVAMATGGKIFGIANVFRHSILHHDSLLVMVGWGVFGFFLLVTGYVTFEFLTPKFNVDTEIANNNRAVGFLSMVISIGSSYVIGAGIY